MFQITMISVDDTTVALTTVGALAGTAYNHYVLYKYKLCNYITIFISQFYDSFTVRPLPHTGVGSDRDSVVDIFL